MKAIIASPRGFCAGVDRAIKIVELTLQKYGLPLYVRHEIVHNKFVVESLRKKGVIFVEELNEIPKGSNVVFSAHGVAPEIYAQAKTHSLNIIDATCPLVSKVHYEVQKFAKEEFQIILIGHKNHPEVIGIIGEAPNSCTLVESISDIQELKFSTNQKLAFVTQTTLSTDETQTIVNELRKKYPNIISPPKEDICYATTNRQKAVKEIAPKVDIILIIGSKNSSNTQKLASVAKKAGVSAHLIDGANEINPVWLQNKKTIGITAGASAPEIIIKEVIKHLKELGVKEIHEEIIVEENIIFSLPKSVKE